MFILWLPLINVRWLLVSWNGKLIFEWNIIEIHFQAANVTISQYLQSENITTVPCRQPAPNVFQSVATLWFFNILCLTWRQEPDQVLKSKTKMTKRAKRTTKRALRMRLRTPCFCFAKEKPTLRFPATSFKPWLTFCQNHPHVCSISDECNAVRLVVMTALYSKKLFYI